MKNTYGTGCFLLMNTGKRLIHSQAGLLTTIAATLDCDTNVSNVDVNNEDVNNTDANNKDANSEDVNNANSTETVKDIECKENTQPSVDYALEGSVFVAGAAIQWLRDGMELVRNAAESEQFAAQTENTEGMYLVPAFAGLGAPYWNPYARGTIVGVTRGTTKAHFIRATLESIAYQTADLLHAMEQDSGIGLKSLKVDGGASANDFLMQFQADVIDADTVRPGCIETTALGAAYLAGLAVGYWKDREEIKENWKPDRIFSAHMEPEKREALLKGWHKAVKCALAWTEE